MKAKEVVLVVGEDISYMTFLKETIAEFGYDCYTANNMNEGMQLAFDYSPDLIVCYAEHHYLKSFDFFNILKESSLTYDVPFVLIVEDICKDEVRFALEIGVDGIFNKPNKPSDISRIIDGRIRKHVRMKREAEHDFFRSFDVMGAAVAIYNTGFKVLKSNDHFQTLFEASDEKPIWELLGLDMDSFIRLSYKIFANYDGLEVFTHKGQIGGEEIELLISIGNMNTIFAKRSAFVVIQDAKMNQKVGEINYGQESIGLSRGVLLCGDAKEAGDVRSIGSIRRSSGHVSSSPIDFTKRQLQVLELSIQGLPMKLIADKLCISEKTVEKYRASLMEKTGAKNIIELVIFAIKNKYVQV